LDICIFILTICDQVTQNMPIAAWAVLHRPLKHTQIEEETACRSVQCRNVYLTLCLKHSSLIPHIQRNMDVWSRNADWIHFICPEWTMNVWWNSYRANVSRTVLRNTKRCQTVEMGSQNCSCG